MQTEGRTTDMQKPYQKVSNEGIPEYSDEEGISYPDVGALEEATPHEEHK